MVEDKEIESEVVKFLDREVRRSIMLIHSATSISSPRFDGMPKGSSNGNSSERKMIAYADAKAKMELVNAAFDMMDDDEAAVLQGLYVKGWTITKISMELCLSRRSVFRLRKRGLLDFAYCYNAGELIDRLTSKETA